MDFLSSVRNFHNSNLYFSKNELSKIFACYSLGVSKGSWKDYAIYFGESESSFYMFRHSLTAPDCVLTKSQKNKKNVIFYDVKFANITKLKFNKIDDIIALLRRKEFNIL